MDSITLPFWQFIGAVALPSMLLALLVARLLAKKRRLRATPAPAASMEHFSLKTAGTYDNRIYQEMVSQQIDSVFNALNAVIEAERVKLKALLIPQTHDACLVDRAFQTKPQNLAGKTEKTEKPVHGRKRYHRQHRDDDHGLDVDLVGQEQISRNEAALARMLRSQAAKKRHGVQAVA